MGCRHGASQCARALGSSGRRWSVRYALFKKMRGGHGGGALAACASEAEQTPVLAPQLLTPKSTGTATATATSSTPCGVLS
jgi:hypothetical protein